MLLRLCEDIFSASAVNNPFIFFQLKRKELSLQKRTEKRSKRKRSHEKKLSRKIWKK